MVVRNLAISIVGLMLFAAAGCGGPSVANPIASELRKNASANDLTRRRGDAEEQSDSVAEPTSTVGVSENKDPSSAAVPPAQPAPQRPPADRSTTKPGDAEKITWDDLNLGMQADVVFRPFMISGSDRLKELEGKRISIVGYMHGGQAGQRGIKEFILLKNTQCKFGPGGQADHLADVKLKADSSVLFTPSPIKVEGTLVLEPFQGPDGNTWSIYRLEAAQVRN
jgi:hypothetical protein